MRHTFNRAVRHGVQLYHTMRHHASVWDGRVRAAAHIYGSIVQPTLRMHGVDTRGVDRTLKTTYDHYDQYASRARDGVQVMDGLIGHLRSGYQYT